MENEFKYDVYLAGPFFNPAQIETMDAVKLMLKEHGLKVADPRELSPVIVDLPPEERKAALFAGIFRNNIDAMDDSYSIIACIDDRDTGTSFELGYMCSEMMARSTIIGKSGPIVTFSAHGHGCNVMLSQATSGHYSNLQELADDIQYLSESILNGSPPAFNNSSANSTE